MLVATISHEPVDGIPSHLLEYIIDARLRAHYVFMILTLLSRSQEDLDGKFL